MGIDSLSMFYSLKCCNFLVHLQAFIVRVLQLFVQIRAVRVKYYVSEMQIRPFDSLIKAYWGCQFRFENDTALQQFNLWVQKDKWSH